MPATLAGMHAAAIKKKKERSNAFALLYKLEKRIINI